MAEYNPYAASLVDDVQSAVLTADQAEYERIRRHHIGHEASIKSMGVLYYLGSVLLILVSIGIFIALAAEKANQIPGYYIAFAVLYLGLGIFQFSVARGLRALKPWAQTASGVLSAIGLLGIPIGTLISIYFLYLLFSQKGRTVFSEPYKEVIAATPHIRYKTSVIAWIALILVLALLVIAIGFAVTA